MTFIITAVIFFFIGKYSEQIKDWWNEIESKDKLGDN
jgi:hypothetical protein